MKQIGYFVRFILISLCLPGLPVALAGSPQPPLPSAGKALLISDLHFDPLADPSLVKRLIDAPVSDWETIFSSSKQTGYAHAPQDANYPLIKSALSAAAGQSSVDFVVGTGDYLRHNFEDAFLKAGGTSDQFTDFATKTALFVVRALQTSFRAPVYFALGNDDSACGDYRVDPGGPFLAALAESLDVLKNHPNAAADFRAAGFYELPHPTLANHEIVVLNTVLWSRSYAICGSDSGDAGEAEMQWLSWQLYQAKTSGNRVMLMMHIPPGIDSYKSAHTGAGKAATEFWQTKFFTQFLDLMKTYASTVQIALAGHTHMDDFRVLSPGGNASPVAFRITPAISPIFGNNPGFSVLEYQVGTGEVSDIATYYLNLAGGGSDPKWALEYRFSSAYRYNAFSAENLQSLAAAIHSDPSVRHIFAGFYATCAPSPIKPDNWQFYTCSETQFTSSDYGSCVSRQQNAPKKSDQ
ncbi:MAG: metallophosphoesterase [Verrucomicrobia bacterium]|nr:metallophosphoesterase [Verrucomicrobiota bacterium]